MAKPFQWLDCSPWTTSRPSILLLLIVGTPFKTCHLRGRSSSDGRFPATPGLLARVLQAARDGVGSCSLADHDSGRRRAATEAINDHLRCNDAEAHGENNCNRRHGVGDGCTQEVEVCIRVVRELHKSACHPEQEDTGHHRYYRGKANGGEWHPPATRDWSKDPAGQQTGDQGASRYSGTRKSRTSKALGVRETGESARDSVRLPGSSTNCPKRYKLLIGTWLAYRAIQSFSPFFSFF